MKRSKRTGYDATGPPAELAEDIRRHLRDRPCGGRSTECRLPGTEIRAAAQGRSGRLPLRYYCSWWALRFGERIQANRIEGEREIAEQVSEFLVELFEVSDPETTGRSVTAREILDRGALRVEQELKGPSLVKVRLMETIGRV